MSGGIEIGPEGITPDQVSALINQMATRQQRVLGVYRQLVTDRKVSTARLLSYRCPRGCLLLDVFETPDGPSLYWPTHRRSPASGVEKRRSDPTSAAEAPTPHRVGASPRHLARYGHGHADDCGW